MEEIVIPDLDEDDDDFSLPSLSRHGFGSETDTHTHRTAASTSSDSSFAAPRFGKPSTTPTRPVLPKNASYSVGVPTPAHGFGEPPRMGKLSNGSSSSLIAPSVSSAGGGIFGGRKGSLASIKNAFKSTSAAGSGAGSAIPPVPHLDARHVQPGYPALRNPFSRFDTAPLSPSTPVGRPGRSGKAPSTSSPAPSAYHTYGERKQSVVSNAHSSQRSHGGRSATSQGSSNFRAEDHPLPALPKIPSRSTPSRMGRQGSDVSAFGFARYGSMGGGEDAEEQFGRRPADEALRLAFDDFREAANVKIARILTRPLNSHISLPAFLEAGIDPAFDELIGSLSNAARSHTRRIVELLTGWCRAQCEAIQAAEVRAQLSRSMDLRIRVEDAAAILGSRKSSAAKYIYIRALIELVRAAPKEAFAADVGMNVENTAFGLYKPDRPDEHAQYPHRRAVLQLVVELLGHLSNTRFLTVSDRFTRELAALVNAPPAKDTEHKIEHFLRGMRHLKLKVYPEDELEMSAEFVQVLASFFANAHGQALKNAYAETLTHLLHPVVETATAEVNHPIWSKANAIILQRAMAMASKPRYWTIAFPLVVVSLAVSPREVFMEHFPGLADSLVQKYKDRDRSLRVVGVNGFVRLLWVYLNRCPESATSTRKRLDNLLRSYLPPQSSALLPPELPLEPYISIVHYVMTRQFDYGEDMVFDALRECAPSRSQDIVQPDRAVIALRAMTQTLKAIEDERGAPWPMSADFGRFETDGFEVSGDDFTGTNDEAQEFILKVGPTIFSVLVTCDRGVGTLLLSSDGASLSAQASSAAWDGPSETVTRKHGDLYVTYAARLEPALRLLATLLDTLPRCLPPDANIPQLASILCRATFSADPLVCDAASAALRRVAQNPAHAPILVDACRQFIFDTRHVFRDVLVGVRLFDSQLVRVAKLWLEILQTNASQQRALRADGNVLYTPPDPTVVARIEGVGLLLLCSASVSLRRLAEPVLAAARELSGQERRPSAAFRYSRLVMPERTSTSVHLMYEAAADDAELANLRRLPSLTSNDRHRLDVLAAGDRTKFPLRIAESDNTKDVALWLALLPTFVARLADVLPVPVAELRALVGAAAVRLQPHVASVAALTRATPVKTSTLARSSADAATLADQWRLYLSVLCVTMPTTTAAAPSTPPVRGGKEPVLSADMLASPQLFGYLLSLLAVDDRRFQDAAVHALGSIRQTALRPVAEMLLNFVRRLADGYKTGAPRNATMAGAGISKSAQGAMWTAAAHVFRLISPLIIDGRSASHLANLSSMIGFVKITHTLLADRTVKDDYDLQSLRRWFCVVVDNLTTALGKLEGSDRFLGDESRGAIFKLCYEWCSVGRRPDVAKARESHTLQAAADSFRGERDKAQYLDDLQAKTKLLSAAAAEAMAGLCQGKVISNAVATPETQASDHIVEPLTVLRWIRGMFSSSQPAHHETARRALHALLKYNWIIDRLADEVLHQSFGEGEQFGLDASFFGVVADAVADRMVELPAERLACLCLSKLGHPVADVRQRAFQLALWLFADPQERLNAAAELLPAVGSGAPNIYRHAQKEMAARLASMLPDLALPVLAECTTRLSQLEAPRRQATLGILPAWLAELELEADTSALSPEEVVAEHQALFNLVYIAVRFSDDHLDDVRDIFTAFAGTGRSRNTTALTKFLFEQGSKRRSPDFVAHAQQVMACLAQSPAAEFIFDEICGFVQPGDMAATAMRTDGPPSPELKITSLDSAPARSHSFSQGQMALFFAGELLPHRLRDVHLHRRLPVLLHVAFVHVDDASPAIREQAQHVLFQVLRAWICDVSHVAEADKAGAWAAAEAKVAALARQRASLFWKADDAGAPETAFHAPAKMAPLVAKLLGIAQPLQPRLRQAWGELALTWATSCPIRHLACRSFQVFRILAPAPSPRMISDTLARLSSTIGSAAPEIQAFNAEVIRTFAAVVQGLTHAETAAYPQIFWCAMATLTTPYESEFNEAVDFLSHVLDKHNLADPAVVARLVSFKPADWVGPSPHLQALLLVGLRSCKTDMMTFDVIRRLTSVPHGDLIDADADRLLHGFVAALPWMLHSTDLGEPNDELAGMALDLAELAGEDSGLARLLTSFARNRFRSKDDFIRQAAGLLREAMAAGPQHALEIVTVLVGFVLNVTDWVREKALQVLKLVVPLPEARGPLVAHGHELLQPLIRLVSTRHAAAALEVLDLAETAATPVPDAAAPPAPASIFGQPTKSGWSVPNAAERTAVTRGNVQAVFGTCAQETRAASAHFSVVEFADLRAATAAGRPGNGGGRGGGGGHAAWHNPSQVSIDIPLSPPISADASMGDLVGALHSLNQFFDDGLDDSADKGAASPRGYGYGSYGGAHAYGHAAKLSDSISEHRMRAVMARANARTPSISSPGRADARRGRHAHTASGATTSSAQTSSTDDGFRPRVAYGHDGGATGAGGSSANLGQHEGPSEISLPHEDDSNGDGDGEYDRDRTIGRFSHKHGAQAHAHAHAHERAGLAAMSVSSAGEFGHDVFGLDEDRSLHGGGPPDGRRAE
ncbi:Cell morphogenesis protein PAG1 [Cryptotrichosporon argae]